MVYSTQSKAKPIEFETLLSKSIDLLHEKAKADSKYFLSQTAQKLEDDVFKVMKLVAKGGPFEGTIVHVSGQKFPDIVANKFYGVEVKTTTQDHWRTTGNSVLESTRVDGVERIFILFGKLVEPVAFKYRKYEECLTEVVVTHSPRYLIDMDTSKGDTIFDKIKVEYDELRKSDKPIKPIVDYYRKLIKPGDDVWWLDTGEDAPVTGGMIVRLWSSLTSKEQEELLCMGMALFPGIFGTNPKKYAKISTWLAARHGIVSPNIRDNFSAGGQVEITIKGITYPKVPKIYKRLQDRVIHIKECLETIDAEEIARYWGSDVSVEERFSEWIRLVRNSTIKLPFNIEEMILDKADN